MNSVSNSKLFYFPIISLSCAFLVPYGLIAPFSKSYLIISYSFFVLLNFYGVLITVGRKMAFILLYVIASIILGILTLSSLLHYLYIISILFFSGLIMSIVFYQEELKDLKKVMIAQQGFFPLIMSLSLLNINNIIQIKQIHFSIVNPLHFLHIGLFSLFFGAFTGINPTILDSPKLIIKGFYIMIGGIVFLSIGIFDILMGYHLSILAALCGLFGWIITPAFALFYYYKSKHKDGNRQRGILK